MAHSDSQARQQLLDTVAAAADELGFAVSSLAEAYEVLDEHSADRLEQQLFRPVQRAYGRAKRTHAEFAARHQLPARTFEQAGPGAPSRGVRGFLEAAVEAVARADASLSTLQDSMLPVELGDAELRAGLTEVRTLLAGVRARERELVRTLGR